ncbi:MAG: histone deacetylase [Thermoleophilia bacterium]|nr:histone deacetylase [Thermoleophilia bacterium]
MTFARVRHFPARSAKMQSVRTFTHDRWHFPLPPANRFPQEKYRLVRERVQRLPGVEVCEGPPISWDDALLVHDAEWIRRIRYGLLTRHEEAALGLTRSPELAQRTLHATGSTVAATRSALTDGVAAALGGGTHHAQRAVGRGYCLVNDVAVSLQLIRLSGFIGKCLILDLDVHQGDGNADCFTDDPDVFVVSIHGEQNYPFVRVPSDIDIDVPDRTGDDGYLALLDGVLDDLNHHAPFDLAFLLCDADPWQGDRLGRLSLTIPGLEERDRRAITWIRDRGTPLVITLAGGYGEPIETTADIQARSVALAAERG